MAYLQGFVRKLAESPVSFRAEFGGHGGNLVQNLYKIRTSLRFLRPPNELAGRKHMRGTEVWQRDTQADHYVSG
ncbi:MAG: hypothetical protein ACI9ND_001040 [Yoonia sp.]|jgi:hypothetical protein